MVGSAGGEGMVEDLEVTQDAPGAYELGLGDTIADDQGGSPESPMLWVMVVLSVAVAIVAVSALLAVLGAMAAWMV